MLWAFLILFFLDIDPADVGIVVNELTEDEQKALDNHYGQTEQGEK